jgi:hypothetical protein
MTPEAVHGLQALALASGGSLTINPDTGLYEASWLKKLLPAIAGMAPTYRSGVGTAIGSALGMSGAVGTGLLVGGVTGLATGSLKQGIMAGLGAYGGASMMGGWNPQECLLRNKRLCLQRLLRRLLGLSLLGNATAEAVARNQLAEQATKDYLAGGAMDRFTGGISALGTEAGRTAALRVLAALRV